LSRPSSEVVIDVNDTPWIVASTAARRTFRAVGGVADGHPSSRRALKRLLEEDGDMEVVGEAGDVESAVESARACRPPVCA
jgi:hypothetical protein